MKKKRFFLNYFERIHLQKDFIQVFKNGQKFENKYIKILIHKRNDEHLVRRLGLIVSRKIGKAVERNKVKRKLREIFRINKHLLKTGFDFVFIPKVRSVFLDYNNLMNVIFDEIKNAECFLEVEIK
ncbi:MAG: ribonuclease P protein component [Endomicrobium sp.]|jgi:ribonuclease P protein component|nr:ribonuclease P protein component [Endomicrobium sp.]